MWVGFLAIDGMCGAGFFLRLLAVLGWVTASEFPERECCDLEYPKPQPTVPTSSVATSTTTGRNDQSLVSDQSVVEFVTSFLKNRQIKT